MIINRNRGFTLVELITIVAIIAILSAVAIPTFGQYQLKAQEEVCKANRRTLLRQYVIHYIGIDALSLNDYMAQNSDEIKHITCPSGGDFSPHGQGTSASLSCSDHSDNVTEPAPASPVLPEVTPTNSPTLKPTQSPTIEPTQDVAIIPGTNGLRVKNVGYMARIVSGDTFYYNSKYYIGLSGADNPIEGVHYVEINTTHIPVKNLPGSFSPCDYSTFISRYGTITRGDMILYNNKYYVLHESAPGWMAYPGNWPWVRLYGQ